MIHNILFCHLKMASGSLAPNALPSPRPQGGIFCTLCSWIHYLVGLQKLLINGFGILQSL